MEFEDMHWVLQTAIAFVICCLALTVAYWALVPTH